MENDNKLKIEDMLEVSTIQDSEEYVPGIYNNKNGAKNMGCNGFYLQAIDGTVLKRAEIFTSKKFQLENDYENYIQDARFELWLSTQKYYNIYGEDCTVKPDGWIYKDLTYKMMDKAKLAKSNVSTCDRKTGKYYINGIESFEQKFLEESDKLKNQRDERFLSMLYNVPIDDKFIDHKSTNKFIQWFKENAEYILTKKQLDWLNGEIVINDASGVWRLRKNICKKTEKAYSEDTVKSEKIKRLNKYLKSITYLLDFKDEEDLKLRLYKMSTRKEGIIIDLYKNINLKDCETLTTIISKEDKDMVSSVECDKKFLYRIVDVLISKENETNNLIYNIEYGDDSNGFR